MESGSGSKTPVINVGMGEMKVARPPARLSAVGIGSCVAVILWDSATGAGGMAHVMLPHQPKRVREGANRFKYADYAITSMVEGIVKAGGNPEGLVAKLVGGAHMFEASETVVPLDIGSRNLDAVRQVLVRMEIPVLAEDSGGNHGRSVELSLADGTVRSRSIRKGVKIL
jgi:chemotaxis protein CheD